MASKHSSETTQASGSALARSPEPNQLDFEIAFFDGILQRLPDYVDVLRVQGNNLTMKGRHADGLQIDKRLVRLRPNDPLAHYNLACSYSLLRKNDLAIKTLRQAIELGYRDLRYLREDRDLDPIRNDPRFKQMLREFANC